ncbi:hypothetical protein CLV51_1011524 [Chitinophaga niastensis]|uniref:Uncharacterized protein n=1 Tax=Chitinophaga niastensis TaxID=536980 RepID=A0A2P8HVD7_CHINA|nr:hypothetical protein [Chitinophaga niastensis]PSL50180.1 hypothetical protein CLV51_1011524 [Chitinophaga niastensis]
MNSEIFRFSAIRPPQQVPVATATDNSIALHKNTSPFLDALRQQRLTNSRSAMLALKDTYVKSVDFLYTTQQLDAPYAAFYVFALNGQNKLTNALLNAEFTKDFGTTPNKIVGTDPFKALSLKVVNSLVAAIMDASITPAKKLFITKLVYLFEIIQRLSANDTRDPNLAFKAKILLPDGIFPLPLVGDSLAAQRKDDAAKKKAADDAKQKKTLELATTLNRYNGAVKEIISAYEKSNILESPYGGTITTPPTPAAATASAPVRKFTLPVAAYAQLSNDTKDVIKNIGITDTEIDIVKSTFLVQKQASEIAQQLYNNPSNGKVMVRIGNNILPVENIVLNGNILIDDGTSVPTPGICPPATLASDPTMGDITLPSGHGEARILGIADLMIVEQELLRYEQGEIAHVENVLKSEMRERKLRTLTSIEVTNTTETQITDTKEKDLSSTERYELQSQTQQVISDNSSKQTGITVNASYGPSVSVTANYNTSNSSAQQDSKTASSNFARETTSRAVSRIEQRTLESRVLKTLQETEETNTHSFDNKAGTDNISGVYRWLDKYYHAQIINYGKRLMLEFVVPEPAAFLRYALAKQPAEDITVAKPDAPGYCMPDRQTFVSLKVQDVTRDNYLYWVSKYNVEDVTPPPPAISIASVAKNVDGISATNQGGTTLLNSSMIEDVGIQEGYIPKSANINVYGENQVDDFKHVTIQIQNKQLIYRNAVDEFGFIELLPIKTNKLPITINSASFNNYEVLITVLCTLSPEKFQEWQLNTFKAIMNAYNDQKTKYDNAIATLKIQANIGVIQGTNPAQNRETEQIELKRGCISLLTGQRFELFDAMNRNVAPYGYPEIDFAEAKAEGPYIEFFEQACEWTNITYVFYPYFWSKKDEWITLIKLDDTDPLFGKFLQAGAARVQLPVRPGFENSMLNYLTLGEIWNGEAPMVNTDGGNADPLQLSILDELKAQLGNSNYEGNGKINVNNGSDAITGISTEFTADDENRRIIISGKTYIIKTVVNTTQIQLRTAYADTSTTGIGYSLGAKLVGEPWEVKIPTSLVRIDPNPQSIIL